MLHLTPLRQLVSVHSGEDLPVELLRCYSVEWDRLDGPWPAIGQHAPDHPLRLLNETANRFIGQILPDGLVLGGRGCPP